jgi:GNAT superfamily N-acetyltransferase
MDYWVNKPQLEIIRVFSNKDDSFTDYSKDEQPKTKRLNIKNWQGHGIGASLYEFCTKWCSDRNMVLWASSTRTEDAKRMWNSMEKLPKFTILANEARKYTNLGTISSSTERLTIQLS